MSRKHVVNLLWLVEEEPGETPPLSCFLHKFFLLTKIEGKGNDIKMYGRPPTIQ